MYTNHTNTDSRVVVHIDVDFSSLNSIFSYDITLPKVVSCTELIINELAFASLLLFRFYIRKLLFAIEY